MKGKSYIGYKSNINKYIIPKFCNRKLTSIRAVELQTYFDNLLKTKSVSTVLTIRRIFIIFLNAARRLELLDTNVAQLTRPPRRIRQPDAMISIAKMQELLLAAETITKKPTNNIGTKFLRYQYEVLLKLAVASGARQGELIALSVNDWNPQSCNLSITKAVSVNYHGKTVISTPKSQCSVRNITIDEKTADTINCWLSYRSSYINTVGDVYKDRKLIFSTTYGGILSMTDFTRRWFRPLLNSLRIDKRFHFHSLRKFNCSVMVNAGIPITTIKSRLGHESFQTSLSYYTVDMTNQNVAVNVFKNIMEEKKNDNNKKTLPDADTSGKDNSD